jgi:hypothetical protein
MKIKSLLKTGVTMILFPNEFKLRQILTKYFV